MQTAIETFSRGASADLAIDFGTSNTRVFVPGEGIVFDEPSLCCFSSGGSRPALVAVGAKARDMLDRTSGALRISRPLRRGVLDDMEAGRELLLHAIRSAVTRRRLRSLRAVIGIPADATQAESKALLSTAADAGLRGVRLVAEPLAAAIGAGLPVTDPQGSMLVECGAGTSEVVILSLGAVCVHRSVRVGGLALDTAIADHLHYRHKFLIGAGTAERVKLEIVDRRDDLTGSIEIKGRKLVTGGPGVIAVPALELAGIVERHATHLVDVIRDALIGTPPELSRDIHDKGIMLTGGGATVALLGAAIARATGLQINVAEQPLHCVVQGLGALA
ncbi:MAG: rod shape-determining protein [Sphingomonas sp.]